MAEKDVSTTTPEEAEEFDDVDDVDDLDDVEVDEDALEDELDDDIEPGLDDEEDLVVDEDADDEPELDGDSEEEDDHDEETAEALEELENQELQLLDEEANEALLVDEVAELRELRRQELTMNVDAQSQKDDEFVCQSCFMVKRTSQLANKRKMICFDCVE